MPRLDMFDPPTARSPELTLALARPLDPLRANTAIDVTVSLSALAIETGLALPLILSITSPSSASRGRAPTRRLFTHAVPTSFSFTPREGGDHLVVLSEAAHNLFHGVLLVEVAGDQL
jgi:hypothetical protein